MLASPPATASAPAPARFPAPFHWGLLALALAGFLTVLLGQRGLNEPDEGRYANIALGFLTPGADQWEPRMSGFAHYDKPPLVYWVSALSLRVFGHTEAAARLPSVLGAFLALAGLAWAAARLHGAVTAWVAVLICGTLGQFWVLARLLSPDMLLTGFCTLAIAAWAETRHRGGSVRFWCLGLLFWTLAWWTKATPALIPLAGLTLALLWQRDREGLRALRPGRLLVAILVLGSPWFLVMMWEHPECRDFFFKRELAGRIAGHVDGRRGPLYYHWLNSLIAWSPWLPALALASVLRRRALADSARQVPWRQRLGVAGVIVLLGLIILSLISSKLITYTLPLAPWFALLAARWLLALRPVLSPRAFAGLALGSVALLAGLVVAALFLLPRREAALKSNSSLRPIVQRLQFLGARTIYFDRYWPGAEFYFGHRVRYFITRAPRQRPDDDGLCPELRSSHFAEPAQWDKWLTDDTPPVWAIRYRRTGGSPFADSLDFTGTRETLGDFTLIRLR